MITLPPKIETDDKGQPCNSFPDGAPAEFIAVRFDGTNYVFYEDGDAVPADA